MSILALIDLEIWLQVLLKLLTIIREIANLMVSVYGISLHKLTR